MQDFEVMPEPARRYVATRAAVSIRIECLIQVDERSS